MSLPVAESLFRGTDWDLDNPNSPDAVVEDVVQLVIIGGIDQWPPVLLAICIEAVDGPGYRTVISHTFM